MIRVPGKTWIKSQLFHQQRKTRYHFFIYKTRYHFAVICWHYWHESAVSNINFSINQISKVYIRMIKGSIVAVTFEM